MVFLSKIAFIVLRKSRLYGLTDIRLVFSDPFLFWTRGHDSKQGAFWRMGKLQKLGILMKMQKMGIFRSPATCVVQVKAADRVVTFYLACERPSWYTYWSPPPFAFSRFRLETHAHSFTHAHFLYGSFGKEGHTNVGVRHSPLPPLSSVRARTTTATTATPDFSRGRVGEFAPPEHSSLLGRGERRDRWAGGGGQRVGGKPPSPSTPYKQRVAAVFVADVDTLQTF